MVEVGINWRKVAWMPNETWKKTTWPKLQEVGMKPGDLERCVYVIRLAGNYCIDYPLGTSPTLYIGEGTFNQRINAHRDWVKELEDLVGKFTFEVRLAVPRVNNSPLAYRDYEAALLIRFGKIFGSAPMWNKQFERRRNPDYVYKQSQIDQAICKGSGAKYKWSIKPMKASPFHGNFERTHL